MAQREGLPPSQGGWTQYRLAYVQFGAKADTIWLAPASNPREGTALAQVEHPSGWGIRASLSPDGRWVAYVALPPETPYPQKEISRSAEVWVVSTFNGERRRLAQRADGHLSPIWSSDSAFVAFRSVDEADQVSIWVASVWEGWAKELGQIARASPIGVRGGGATVYLAQGTRLLAMGADGETREVVNLPVMATYDWSLLPGGRQAAVTVEDSTGWHVWLIDLEEGSWEELALPRGDGPIFRPLASPRGDVVALGLAPRHGPKGLILADRQGYLELPAPEKGFYAPLAWSPQGEVLLAAHYSAYPVQEEPEIAVITREGEVIAAMEGKGMAFLGWVGG